jgi:hypothetical protein
MKFAVIFWTGHPSNDSSSPLACSGFNDPNEAMRVFMAQPSPRDNPSHIEIDGFSDEQLAKLGQVRVRQNPDHKPVSNVVDMLTERDMRANVSDIEGDVSFSEEMEECGLRYL